MTFAKPSQRASAGSERRVGLGGCPRRAAESFSSAARSWAGCEGRQRQRAEVSGSGFVADSLPGTNGESFPQGMAPSPTCEVDLTVENLFDSAERKESYNLMRGVSFFNC